MPDTVLSSRDRALTKLTYLEPRNKQINERIMSESKCYQEKQSQVKK